jgi:hypothetical protein
MLCVLQGGGDVRAEQKVSGKADAPERKEQALQSLLDDKMQNRRQKGP